MTKIKKTKVEFEVIVRLLEYHNVFGDIKLFVPLHGLTIIRECIGKHVKWNGYDCCPFQSLPMEVELDSPTPSTLSIPTEEVKVKMEAPSGHESNCDGSEDAHRGTHDKNVDPNDH